MLRVNLVGRRKLLTLVVALLLLGFSVGLYAVSAQEAPSLQQNAANNSDKKKSSADVKQSTPEVLAEGAVPEELPEATTAMPPIPKPSPEIRHQVETMPSPKESSYVAACQKLKTTYTKQYELHISAELKRHEKAQHNALEAYAKAGMAFSKNLKALQQKEADMHAKVMEQLKDQYHKQVDALSC